MRKTQKILITGAGGYIGSISTKLFLENNFQVVALDNFSKGFKSPLSLLGERFKKRLKVYDADLIGDLSAVFSEGTGIDVVVHYAGLCSPEESVRMPDKYFTNNVLATQSLIHLMKKNGVNKIVSSSTCAVYGEPREVPVKESHAVRPLTPYGTTKLQAEEEIGKSGLNFILLRYFNVCGATDDGALGDSKKPCETLVQRAVRGALGIEPFVLTCPKVNTPDGTPIRDYVDVLDLAEAHLLAVNHLLSGKGNEVFNLGTGSGYSVLEVVKTVEEITGKRIEVKSGKQRSWEFAKITASFDKAKRILGWSPKRTLRDSINSLILWYTKYPHGWKD